MQDNYKQDRYSYRDCARPTNEDIGGPVHNGVEPFFYFEVQLRHPASRRILRAQKLNQFGSDSVVDFPGRLAGTEILHNLEQLIFSDGFGSRERVSENRMLGDRVCRFARQRDLAKRVSKPVFDSAEPEVQPIQGRIALRSRTEVWVNLFERSEERRVG